MLNKTTYFLILIIGLTTTISCSNDDSPAVVAQKTLTLKLNWLEDVGENFIYENWLIVDGSAVAAGTFSVNSEGALSETKFLIGLKADIITHLLHTYLINF